MMHGKCIACGASWSAKCVKSRNVFWNETTPKQFECRHTQNTINPNPKCDYSGCNMDRVEPQFAAQAVLN